MPIESYGLTDALTKFFLILLLMSALLIIFAGCGNSASSTASSNPFTNKKDTSNPQNYALVIKLRLVSIEVPLGMASSSEEIWSYLDEERTRAVRSAALGRNGLRLGVAHKDSWPDLAKILQHLTGQKLMENYIVALPGRPVQINLKVDQGKQTIFTSYEDRTLSGSDYPPGDNLLALNCSLDENNITSFVLTGMPQIRSLHRKTEIVKDVTGLMMTDRPVIFSFDAATFQLPMTNNEILVIGPGAESRRPTSIGYHFFVHEKQDILFETILVLIPEVVKAPLREQPA